MQVGEKGEKQGVSSKRFSKRGKNEEREILLAGIRAMGGEKQMFRKKFPAAPVNTSLSNALP